MTRCRQRVVTAVFFKEIQFHRGLANPCAPARQCGIRVQLPSKRQPLSDQVFRGQTASAAVASDCRQGLRHEGFAARELAGTTSGAKRTRQHRLISWRHVDTDHAQNQACGRLLELTGKRMSLLDHKKRFDSKCPRLDWYPELSGHYNAGLNRICQL